MQVKEFKFSNLLSDDEVFKSFNKNYTQFILLWYEFQRSWYYRSITAFNDIDKWFILLYFFRKTFKRYQEYFINKSFESFYSQSYFEIEKFNIIDLAKELNYSKETVRRKILELEKDNFISKDGKSIRINLKFILSSIESKHPIGSVKAFSKLLSSFTKILYEKGNIERSFNEIESEKVIKENFTRLWLFFLDFQINFSLRVRSVFKDHETWFIWAILVYNQTIILSKKLKNKKIELNANQFMKMMPSEQPGLNAMSISDLSGIPRPTVLRKLSHLMKEKSVKKSPNALYELCEGRTLKIAEPLGTTNNKELCSFITKILNLLL